ncbi:MBL fold metallo-hydrolase [Mycobacterium sp. E2462]|uniref:MBL fold metallo-hydrolase n=1 Tax=unclassified Mycobacterium TaxID=2642494 RepID=UPI0007FCF7E1|nr:MULTISPECIES: MBL fold metallo-hydrolase [unclassified Mycobacterium]OBG75760.1 MBL fold metallo-hydrolase [Mycobacterium sp. E1214]OBH29270.1 MBL fold metallo-hydrolase [Mycobacterium sp. E1319]OBI08805.1 MBL fold metallo-hydrolase [Mycobacterium sp. E2462]
MDITVTFIGNATTLITAGGVTLLTDPNFLHRGQRAYLGHGLVSKRLREPALSVDELPPLDAIVLSHMHGDHWDRVSQRGLDHDLPIVTTEHAAKRLQRRGFGRASGLSTWQQHAINKGDTSLTITSLPGRHAPGWSQRLLPPVMGTMLEFAGGDGAPRRRLYISGDTLLVAELKDIPARFDAIDAGVVHLGGTRLPAGPRLPFGLTVTMDGRQGAELVALLKLPKAIPVHFDDYSVFASPLADFTSEMGRRNMADRVLEVNRGASVTV